MVIYLCYVIILIVCVIFPEIALTSAKESINLWTSSVLPSLLPFFIISKLIYYNDVAEIFSKLFKPLAHVLGIPDYATFPFIMSIICGYPTGSRTVKEMSQLNNKNYLGNICYSSSPLFIIGTVGTSILKNVKEGYNLYIIHICTLLIFTVIYSFKQENKNIFFISKKGSVGDAITESVGAILNICGFMIFFNIIIKIITFDFMSEKTKAVLSGIVEFTTGIKGISLVFNNPQPLISFFLSFGGSCVIVQCLSALPDINKSEFIINRIISGCIAYFLCFLYKKTAIYMPIIITLLIIITAYILRRKNNYLLKSSKS